MSPAHGRTACDRGTAGAAAGPPACDRGAADVAHGAPAPEAGEACDRGSITPLIIGMALVFCLLGLGVALLGSAFLTRQNLQNTCDGAAIVAGNALRPDLADSDQAAGPRAAAQNYLIARGSGVALSEVSVSGGAVDLRCSRTVDISAAGLFDLPGTHTFTVAAHSKPALLG